MAAPFKKKIPILLEKDCEFRLDVREGKVLEVRKEGYFVFWQPWVDPGTGEIHDSDASVVAHSVVATEDRYGRLHIINRPMATPMRPDQVRRAERLPIEIARMDFRRQYVFAVQRMLDNDELKPTQADFEAKVIKIAARGKLFYEEHMAAKARGSSKRGGARIRKTAEEKAKEFEFSQGVQSGRTYWKWYQRWKTHGDEGLFDGYRKCGGHSRYTDEVATYVERLVDMLLDEERQTVSSIVDSITAAIKAENERRIRQPVPEAGMPVVGYDYIRKVIIDRAPLDHAIRQKGWDRAYKDFHFLGLGIETSCART